MSENKKISALEAATSGTENKNDYTNSIPEKEEKIKSDFPMTVEKHTDVSKLTKYQNAVIGAVYRHSSRNLTELINNLSSLKFCDVRTAIKSLVNQDYISEKDEEFIIGRTK